MQAWFNRLWIGSTGIGVASLIWFLLGSTANFQRPLDLVGTLALIFVWVPTLAVTTLFIRLLRKGWVPTGGLSNVGIVLGMALLVVLSVILFRAVNVYGWLLENVDRDSLTKTSDGRFEYRFELVNMFQRNSRSRLVLRDLSTGNITLIPFDVDRRLSSYGTDTDFKWVTLLPTDATGRYLLTTTRYLYMPQERYEIDVTTKSARRLE